MMTSKKNEPPEGPHTESPEESGPDDTLARWPDRSHFSEFDQAIAEGLRQHELSDEQTEGETPRS
jgi:hypothetical protein